jgi:hypothetical protein
MRVLKSLCQVRVTGIDCQKHGHARPGARRARTPRGYGPPPGPCPSPGLLPDGQLRSARAVPARRTARAIRRAYRALRPGGVLSFPVGAPQPVTSSGYWALPGFDLAARSCCFTWLHAARVGAHPAGRHGVRDEDHAGVVRFAGHPPAGSAAGIALARLALQPLIDALVSPGPDHCLHGIPSGWSHVAPFAARRPAHRPRHALASRRSRGRCHVRPLPPDRLVACLRPSRSGGLRVRFGQARWVQGRSTPARSA